VSSPVIFLTGISKTEALMNVSFDLLP